MVLFNYGYCTFQDKLRTLLRHLAVRDMAKKAKTAESEELTDPGKVN